MRDALGGVQSALVLGGASEIALATVRALVAGRTRTVILAARRADRLEPAAEELRAGGAASVELVEFDATDRDGHEPLVESVFDPERDIDLVLVAFGVLGDQEALERDGRAAAALVDVNFSGAVSILLPIAARLRRQGHGTIVVLSSVAGERARRANFVYGSSKAGLDAFAQGLGDALHGSGVRVMVVRPGFVRTRMTAHMDPAPLSTTPEAVAAAIVDGLRRGSHTIWVPARLRLVMAVLRHLPRPLFRRLPR